MLAAAITLFSLGIAGCHATPTTVAVIPRTCGTRLWEPLHLGAALVARNAGVHIYWNAPTQENDVEKQIGFVRLALERNYRGVVVVPDESLVFRTPVRDLLNRRIPVVIVDDDLGVPHDANLSYVLNNEATGGQLAARRVASALHGKGSVVVLGIDPKLESITERDRSFEETLKREAPGIRIAMRRLGDDLSVSHEQQIAGRILDATPGIDAIVALSSSATRGAYYAKLGSADASRVVLIGFDQDLLPPIRSGEIDSVVIQNAPEIGRLAMKNILARLKGESVPPVSYVQPILLTKENMSDSQTHRMWQNAEFPWSDQ